MIKSFFVMLNELYHGARLRGFVFPRGKDISSRPVMDGGAEKRGTDA